MTRILTILLPIFLFFIVGAAAAPTPAEEALKDRVLGNANAPVTIIEYSSLACPHCAAFHVNTLPKIKENYIDTGKAKLIFRDFPIGGRAVMAAMVARCAKPERYFQFVDVLFRSQEKWAHGEDAMEALKRIAKLGGLTGMEFDACVNNEALFEGLRQVQLEAQQKFDVNATPTFIIDGEKIVGAQPYETFEKALKKAAP